MTTSLESQTGVKARHTADVVYSTRTSVVVKSPRANSSYEGKRLRVRMEFTGPVHEPNTLYFEYTGNPNVSNLLPSKLINSSVISSFSSNPFYRAMHYSA